MKIVIVRVDEWEVMYVDGLKVHEDNFIDAETALDIVAKFIPDAISVRTEQLGEAPEDDEYPDELSELVKQFPELA